jgi:hypothetical protein
MCDELVGSDDDLDWEFAFDSHLGHPTGSSEEPLAKRSKKWCAELPILHPDAAGFDVGASDLCMYRPQRQAFRRHERYAERYGFQLHVADRSNCIFGTYRAPQPTSNLRTDSVQLQIESIDLLAALVAHEQRGIVRPQAQPRGPRV